MPNEPQRPIEQMLTAYALKRREQVGPPFALHPATRKLLLDEVARTFPRRSAPPASKLLWLKMLWPRMALTGSVAVALGIAAVIYLQSEPGSQRKLQLAKQEDRPSSRPADRDEAPRPEYKSGKVLEGQPARFANAPTAPPPTAGTYSNQAVLPGPAERIASRSKTGPVPLKAGEAPKQVAVSGESSAKGGTMELAYAGKAKATVQIKPQPVEDQRELLGRQLEMKTPPPMVRRYGLPTPPASGGPTGVSGGGGIGGAGRVAPTARGVATPQPSAQASPLLQTPTATNALRDNSETSNVQSYFVMRGELLNQRFTRNARYRRNFNSPVRPEVLNSFQLEQNGRQIRIVDADGSIYDGAIDQPANQSNLQIDALQTAEPVGVQNRQIAVGNQNAGLAGTQSAGMLTLQNFAFTVSGTNRTLNQAVVFYGNYNVDSNAVQLGISNNQAQTQQTSANALPTQNQLQLPNALVQGRALIGASNRLEINAVPVEQ